jgi:hypothetical protein
MGLSIVGVGDYTTGVNNGTSKVFQLPTGYAAGDLLFLFIVHNDFTYPTTPSGWTVASRWQQGYRFVVFRREADGSEGASVTVTTTAAYTLGGGTVAARKGASDTWNPVNYLGHQAQFAESQFVVGDTLEFASQTANSGVEEMASVVFHFAIYSRTGLTSLTLTPDADESEGLVGYTFAYADGAGSFYATAVTADVGDLLLTTQQYDDTWVYDGSDPTIFSVWESVQLFPALSFVQPPIPEAVGGGSPEFEKRRAVIQMLPYYLDTGQL